MARGCWDDFTDKFGFSDGSLTEVRDFDVRDLLVKRLNELLKKYVAIPYDRPGMHNNCLILIFERREDWTDEQYLKGFQSDFVKDVSLWHTDFPDDPEIQDLIDDCYVEVDNTPNSDPTCKACGTTKLLVPHPEPTAPSEMMCADCLLTYWRNKPSGEVSDHSNSNSESVPRSDSFILELIRDAMFLDQTSDGRGFYNPSKDLDFDVVEEIADLILDHYDNLFVNCAICKFLCDRKHAHFHQGEYIGDACCWDDRLKAPE